MIDYLVHFYKRDGEPFQSLSALPDAEAIRIMQSLYVEGSVFWERFKDPAWYLQARRQIEQWMVAQFIAKGGAPRMQHPIYLVLGWTKWLRKGPDATTRATTAQIEVPLSLFDEREISFTYPDSMVSMLMAVQKPPGVYLPEYHGRLFTLAEIRAIVETNGLPGESWGANLPDHLANYIEAQVWNPEVLNAYARQLPR